MSYKAQDWVRTLSIEMSSDRHVMLELAHHFNDTTKACHPSLKTLASEVRLSVPTVRACLERLTKAGYLIAEPHSVEGVRIGTNYSFVGYSHNGGMQTTCTPCKPFTDGENDLHGSESDLQGVCKPFIEGMQTTYTGVCKPFAPNKEYKQVNKQSITPLPPSEPSDPYKDPKWKPNNKGAITFSSFCEQQGLTDGIPLAWKNWVEEVHSDLDPELLFGEFVRYWAKGKGYETARKDWFATFRNSCAQDFVARKCKRKAMPTSSSDRPLASELGIDYDPDPNIAMAQYLEEIERRERAKYHSSEETERRLHEIYG